MRNMITKSSKKECDISKRQDTGGAPWLRSQVTDKGVHWLERPAEIIHPDGSSKDETVSSEDEDSKSESHTEHDTDSDVGQTEDDRSSYENDKNDETADEEREL